MSGLAAYDRVLWGWSEHIARRAALLASSASVGRLSVAFRAGAAPCGVLWLAIAILRVPMVAMRTSRRSRRIWPGAAAGALVVGGLALIVMSRFRVAAARLASSCGRRRIRAGRLSGRLHRFSQSARLGVSFVALVAPAVAMYPSIYADATAAKEGLFVNEYAPDAASQRDDLQRRLQQTVEQIDQVRHFLSSSLVRARKPRRPTARSSSGRTPTSLVIA